ncbi:MAG: DEAD/DEAH box helicase family protein, partial [Ruthenibacterium sp.]
MRDILFPFQETALADLHSAINDAHVLWRENKPQVITFSAPTGAGKTIVMTTLFEEILNGSANGIGEPDSVFIWLSDSPELNEQTRLKIESKSDKIRVRDLVTIDATFNAEYFEGGCIYFLNTQKLGSDKLLTATSDVRQYAIWETLTNTARRNPKKFYVVIDEAHRGTYTSVQAENKAQSLMQKFIKGSNEDGLCIMPLVIGVTATPQRFDTLIAGTSSTVQKVVVPPEQVRESGLLKDRIIIHYPDMALSADLTMFRGAVDNWCKKCTHWQYYCEREQENVVRPILVVQVEDGNEREATHTDLGECVEALEESLGRQLQAGEVVHTFNDRGSISVRGVEIQRIEASRIEEDGNAIVVFFKMNLSTGWDCPRAETMMSFRSAQDYTYIAQLLGRMIRTPLARRIASDAELNSVSLFLPYFDEVTVKNVVSALRDSEAAMPAETGTSKELVTLNRNLAYADVFESMSDLVTYRIDASRKQSPLKLLIQLSRA